MSVSGVVVAAIREAMLRYHDNDVAAGMAVIELKRAGVALARIDGLRPTNAILWLIEEQRPQRTKRQGESAEPKEEKQPPRDLSAELLGELCSSGSRTADEIARAARESAEQRLAASFDAYRRERGRQLITLMRSHRRALRVVRLALAGGES